MVTERRWLANATRREHWVSIIVGAHLELPAEVLTELVHLDISRIGSPQGGCFLCATIARERRHKLEVLEVVRCVRLEMVLMLSALDARQRAQSQQAPGEYSGVVNAVEAKY